MVKIEGRRAYVGQEGCHVYRCAGTVFEKLSTKLTLSFHAMNLMTATRNGLSAKELQRQLGVTYKCAHRMGNQLRELMSARMKAGKPKKVAIVACMRKLLVIINTMLKPDTMWSPKIGAAVGPGAVAPNAGTAVVGVGVSMAMDVGPTVVTDEPAQATVSKPTESHDRQCFTVYCKGPYVTARAADRCLTAARSHTARIRARVKSGKPRRRYLAAPRNRR